MINYDDTVFLPSDITDKEYLKKFHRAVKKAIEDMYNIGNENLVKNMTDAERDAISSPSDGLLIFNTTTNLFNVYNGSAWRQLTDAAV